MKALNMASFIVSVMIVGCMVVMAGQSMLETISYECHRYSRRVVTPLSADEIKQAIIRHNINLDEDQQRQLAAMTVQAGGK
jgi:hypothetical protein